jgi:regulatory protein
MSENKTTKHRSPHYPFNYCVWLLGRRDYSKKELRDKMKRKDVLPQDIEATITKLDEYKYLKNENELAEQWVKALSARGKGPYFILQSLKKMGLPTAAISDDAEKEALLKALRSKRIDPEVLVKYDPKKAAANAKAKRYVMSRGFNLQRAMQLLKDELDSSQD